MANAIDQEIVVSALNNILRYRIVVYRINFDSVCLFEIDDDEFEDLFVIK